MNHPTTPTLADAATTMLLVATFIRTHNLPKPINLTFHDDHTKIQVRQNDWTAWATALAPNEDNPTVVDTSTPWSVSTMVAAIHDNPVKLATVNNRTAVSA